MSKIKIKIVVNILFFIISNLIVNAQQPNIWLKFDEIAGGNVFNHGSNSSAIIESDLDGSGYLSIGEPNPNGTSNVIAVKGDNNGNTSRIIARNVTPVIGAASRTITGWIKLEDTNFKWILNTNGNVSQNERLSIQVVNQKLRLYFGSAIAITSPVSFIADEWNHFAVSYDGTTVKLYVNGIETAAVNILANSNYNRYNFFMVYDGFASDFRVYDTSLSSSSIFQIYDNLTSTINNSRLVLPKVISSNMILQQDSTAKIWGKSAPNKSVEVSSDWTINQTVTSDDQGNWLVEIPTGIADNLGKNLSVHSNDETINLSNIKFGEVWFCSGQSNMKMILKTTQNHELAAAEASNLDLYLFKAGIDTTLVASPQNDVHDGTWKVCDSLEAERFSAVAYHFGKTLSKSDELEDVPIGLILSAVGSTPAESWMSGETINSNQNLYSNLQYDLNDYKNYPSGMYNTLVHPFINYALKGTIWYQGENNRIRYEQYEQTLGLLIDDWRTKRVQSNMPFYIVQIAPFSGYSVGVAGVQLAQFNTYRNTQNTGLVVINDLVSDLSEIHPTQKAEVGERLGNWALSFQYQKQTDFSGPLFNGVSSKQGSVATVNFDFAEGLKSSDGSTLLTDFEVAGSDEVYHPVNRTTINGTKVNLYSSSVSDPLYVRFANSGVAQPNLVDSLNLPASPFKTIIGSNSLRLGNKENKPKKSLDFIKVISNPTVSSAIIINNQFKNSVLVEIFGMDGRKISSNYESNTTNIPIVLTSLSKGTYIIKLSDKNITKSTLIIKE